MAREKAQLKWYWFLEVQPLAAVAWSAIYLVVLLGLDADLEFMIVLSIGVVYAITQMGAAILLPRRLGSNRVESPQWFKLFWISAFVAVFLAFILLRR
jgi:hypothetical protein